MSEVITPEQQQEQQSKSRAMQLRVRWEPYKALISDMASNYVSAESMFSLMTIMISRTPELMACTETSLVGALINCARLGLDPTPELRLVALIPRNNKKTGKKECNFQIMYPGLVKLAKRSKNIIDIIAHTVYKDDVFKIQHHSTPNFIHEPALTSREGVEIIGAYMAAFFREGGNPHIEWMTIDQISKVRNQSSDAGDSKYSPWNTYPEEMIRKTPLKRGIKMLDLEINVQQYIATDERFIHAEDFDRQTKMLNMNSEQQDYENGQDRITVKQDTINKLQQKSEAIQQHQNSDDVQQRQAPDTEPPKERTQGESKPDEKPKKRGRGRPPGAKNKKTVENKPEPPKEESKPEPKPEPAQQQQESRTEPEPQPTQQQQPEEKTERTLDIAKNEIQGLFILSAKKQMLNIANEIIHNHGYQSYSAVKTLEEAESIISEITNKLNEGS